MTTITEPAATDTEQPSPPTYPRRVPCPTCDDELLLTSDTATPLDWREVTPRQACPTCKGRGTLRKGRHHYQCASCHGSRTLGDPVSPREHFHALDARGKTRRIHPRDRKVTEALHREHTCAAPTEDE